MNVPPGRSFRIHRTPTILLQLALSPEYRYNSLENFNQTLSVIGDIIDFVYPQILQFPLMFSNERLNQKQLFNSLSTNRKVSSTYHLSCRSSKKRHVWRFTIYVFTSEIYKNLKFCGKRNYIRTGTRVYSFAIILAG